MIKSKFIQTEKRVKHVPINSTAIFFYKIITPTSKTDEEIKEKKNLC